MKRVLNLTAALLATCGVLCAAAADRAVAQSAPRITFREVTLTSDGTMRGTVSVSKGSLANFKGCVLRGGIRVAKNSGAPYTAESGEGIDTFILPGKLRYAFRKADLESSTARFSFMARGLAGYAGPDPFAVNFLFELVRCGGSRPRPTGAVSIVRALKYCSILTQADRNVSTASEVVEDLDATLVLRKRP